MKCEQVGCTNEVLADNIGRVCAYQIDPDTPHLDHKGMLTCNCCETCRNECHAQLVREHDKNRHVND